MSRRTAYRAYSVAVALCAAVAAGLAFAAVSQGRPAWVVALVALTVPCYGAAAALMARMARSA